MKIFDAAKSVYANAKGLFRKVKTSVSESWGRKRRIFGGMPGYTLATNETIFAAVSKLSNSVASLPLKLYKDFQPINTQIADTLANAPNENMTSFRFFRTIEAMRNTTGNAYVIKEYDNRMQLRSLHILDPTVVEPIVEEYSGELWYEIRGTNGTYYAHNMEILHFTHIHTAGYKGISPLAVLKNTIDFDKEVRKFSLEQMESSIRASFILKTAANLSTEKRQEILENFSNFYSENGGVLIQETGFELEPIERQFIDSKVFEVEKITRVRVATVYNMPAHMLGGEGQSYQSMEQSSLEFVQGTIIPIIRQYEQELNNKLLTQRERLQGLYFKFNVNALLRGDMRTRGEFYFKGVRSGWFTPNEIRQYEELPPKNGGEKLYMSRDLSPIDDRKEVKQQ